MRTIIFAFLSTLCSITIAQTKNINRTFKTYILNSSQWAELKESKSLYLNGVTLKQGQKIKLDYTEEGQLINLKIFEEKPMAGSKVDGNLQ